MKKIISVLMILMLSACASKELAKKSRVVENTSDIKMLVSSEVIKDYSDKYNLLLQVNFESQDGRWIRVDEVEVLFDTGVKAPYNVIIGNDLVTWAEAKAEEKKMNDFNKEMAVGGVSLAGGALAVIGILSQDKTLLGAGALTMAGSSVYKAGSDINTAIDYTQRVQLVPEGHLYKPFTVPSMSFVKRWVLINGPNGNLGRVMKLKLKTVEGDTLTYDIDLAG